MNKKRYFKIIGENSDDVSMITYELRDEAECRANAFHKKVIEISKNEFLILAKKLNKINKEWLGWDNPICKDYWMSKR